MFTHHALLKWITALVFGLFLSVGSASVVMGMTMQMNGVMEPCPFMHNDGGVCPVSLATHVAQWQQLSNARPTEVSLAACALALLAFALSFVTALIYRPILFEHTRRRNTRLRVFATLFFVIRGGILHPKLFVS